MKFVDSFIWYLKPFTGNKICCGAGLIDPNTQHCCHNSQTGQFTTTDIRENLRCCRHITYDTTKQYCYKKHRVLPLHHAMCGKQQYDSRNHACCNHRTLHLITNMSRDGQYCCGDQLYNNQANRCCQSAGGHFIAPKSASCCGSGLCILCIEN